MPHRCLLCAIGLLLWSAAGASGQTAASPTLSRTLREHLTREQFQIVTSIRGLPLGVRDELEKLFGGQRLDIAESWEEFQDADKTLDPDLPLRRLVAAGCSIDHCFVHYERGGTTRTWVVALFHWTPAATRLEWGGYARGALADIGEVRKAALSGTIKGPIKGW
jgi:hypothetical protein